MPQTADLPSQAPSEITERTIRCCPDDYVIGVVFEISDGEKSTLDQKEGLGHGYEEKYVDVITSESNHLHALIYYATRIDFSIKPYRWYKQHVLYGAKENNLPREYVGSIEAFAAMDDPDKDRRRRELAIYA